MDQRLLPKQRDHYQLNLNLLAPLLYMELRGIRYDKEAAKARLKQVERWAARLQHMLNLAAGRTLPTTEEGWVGAIREKLCLAKPRRRREETVTRTFNDGRTKTTIRIISEPASIITLGDCQEFAKESCAKSVGRILALLRKGRLGAIQCSELAELLGSQLKVNATAAGGDSQWFLYTHCGYEKQFIKDGNRLTDRLASDDEALIKIFVGESKRAAKGAMVEMFGGIYKHRGRLALAFLRLRRLLTEAKTLRASTDADGRIRCGYNLLKRDSRKGGPTKTARLACYESPTGSGFNMQTVTKKHRHFFQADLGKLMAQKDLAGADGWTVAAYSAMLGDRTMLEDYKAGIKPAKVGVLMWERGSAVNRLPREELKQLCKQVDGDSWKYFAFKRVQHGKSYLMGDITQSNQILTDSWKLTGRPVVISPKDCGIMGAIFFTRYWGIPLLHKWMAQTIKQEGKLVASNGFSRTFYGRKDDHDTAKEALAHLPQVYTTYATELALLRLWADPDNRNTDGSLKCEPLHTVHDSLLDQFDEQLLEWAREKHRQWFDNPMQIANELITIPAEGAVGRDWKHLDLGAI